MKSSEESKELLILLGLNVNSKNLELVRDWNEEEDDIDTLLDNLGLLASDWNRSIIAHWRDDD